jgi:hypothetical protein
VLLATGDLWIGPEDCTVLFVNGKMLGILMNRATCEIQIFKARPVRLPLSPDSAPLFQDQLRLFEQSFPAQQYVFAPDVRLTVVPLFADEKGLSQTVWYVQKLRIQNNNIVINLNGGSAQAHPEITLEPDLTVVSTRVLGEDWQDVIRQ